MRISTRSSPSGSCLEGALVLGSSKDRSRIVMLKHQNFDPWNMTLTLRVCRTSLGNTGFVRTVVVKLMGLQRTQLDSHRVEHVM